MTYAEIIDGVIVVTIANSNSSELWSLKPVYIPEDLELEGDEALVRWAKERWPDAAVIIQLAQDGDRTGVLPFDFEGQLLLSDADYEELDTPGDP